MSRTVANEIPAEIMLLSLTMGQLVVQWSVEQPLKKCQVCLIAAVRCGDEERDVPSGQWKARAEKGGKEV